MGADLSRVRFDALRDLAGVVLQQGRLLLDATGTSSSRSSTGACARRRDLTSLRAPTRGIAGVAVGAAADPGRLQDHGGGGRDHHRPRAGCTSTDCWRENHGIGPGSVRAAARRDRRYRQTRPTASSRTGRRPTRCPRPGPTSCTWTSGPARSPSSKQPGSRRDRPRRRHHRTHADRVAGPGLLAEHAGRSTCSTPDEKIPGWPAVIRPRPAAQYRHDPGDRYRRSLRAAADRWLPRPGEPDLPRRDPRGRRTGHCDVQVVARTTDPSQARW